MVIAVRSVSRFIGSSGRGTGVMLAGAAISAAGAYGYQVLGGRHLGTHGFAPVAMLWTVMFLVVTAGLLPVEQALIRRVVIAGASPVRIRDGGTLAVASASVLLGVGFVLVTRDRLFGSNAALVVVAALLFPALAVYVLGRAFLAGRRRYRAYGMVVGGEAIARIIVAAALVAVGVSAAGYAAALLAGPVVIMAALPLRTLGSLEPDTRNGRAEASLLGGLFAANGLAQVLVGGGPLLVGAMGGSPQAVSVFFVTFALFRGPLTLSYNLVARVLPEFTRKAAAGRAFTLRRVLWPIVIGALVAAGASTGFGYVAGPSIVAVLFGEGFRPEPLLPALAAGGVVLGMGLLALTQIHVALGKSRPLVAGWTVGIVIALIVVAAAAGDPATRVAWGFVAGHFGALVSVGLGLRAATATQVGSAKSR